MPKKEEKVKEETKEPETLVVSELPKQEVSGFVGEDGKKYTLVKMEDAITEILIKVREIHEAI